VFAAGQIETWVFRVSIAIPAVCLAGLLLWHLVAYLGRKFVKKRSRVQNPKPTLAELLAQYRNQCAGQSFDDEIIAILRVLTKELKTTPGTWRVVVDPVADLPEQASVTLLILPPDCCPIEEPSERNLASAAEQRILGLSKRWGAKHRQYCDSLLFLVPSRRGLTGLRNALQELVAVESIQRDCSNRLDEEQRAELKQWLGKACASVGESLGPAYATVARVEGEQVAFAALSEIKSDLNSHLQAAWRQLVDKNAWILK